MSGAGDVTNPPGLSRLRRRVSDHARAMTRMRASLSGEGNPAPVRALARQQLDDPAIALLDTWAVVSDTVAFYSERIASEGLLPTALHMSSVRELARAIGYEPDPGVAAAADLVVTIDSGPLVPAEVAVPVGTPAQSVPAESAPDGGPAATPQTFETSEPLLALAAWNALAVVEEQPQTFGTNAIWIHARVELTPGVPVVLVPADTDATPTMRIVSAADVTSRLGWTRLLLTHAAPADVKDVLVFRHRARLFGWNAPDANLLSTENSNVGALIPQPTPPATTREWSGFPVVVTTLDLDGEYPDVAGTSWLVIEQAEDRLLRAVSGAVVSGKSMFAVSGPVTTVGTKDPVALAAQKFDRRGAVVHCATQEHSADLAPAEGDLPAPGGSAVLTVPAFEPELPEGRRVILTWAGSSRAVVVERCGTIIGDRRTVTVRGGDLSGIPSRGLVLHGNVVRVTHGETVRQVLGSGDGAATFQTFPLRRGPLTFVPVGEVEGSRPEVSVRVDGVEWLRVRDLGGSGPSDRVYTVRLTEDGRGLIGFGDGITGARLPTGTENVVAAYRVGLGQPGAVAANRIIQLPRRPLGVRDVTNPGASLGWAASETVDQARNHAPRQVRTLDRAVSLADHERFAGGFPGIGTARADLVRDGRQRRVLVSVRSTDETDPDDELLRLLREALEAAREPNCPLDVLAGSWLKLGVEVDVRRDPAWEWARVRADVVAALRRDYGAWAIPLSTKVFATSVLRTVEKVPGVLSCTLPRLELVEEPSFRDPAPGGWDHGRQRPAPAEVLALSTDQNDVVVRQVP